ncbi:hypothetical protein ACFLUP_01750 [Chloroflexota bacterium]
MKRLLLILVVLITGLTSTGCKASVGLGEEFFLSRGRGAVIREENLEITFMEVVEDSRCAKDVTCIWEGRATSLVRIVNYTVDVELELAEPGLTDDGNTVVFRDYLITFHLLPYPQADVETKKGDYQLRLTITKLK